MRMSSGLDVRQYTNPDNDPRLKNPNIPSTTSVPDMPKEIRVDARKIASWTREHLNNARFARQYLERYWISVQSYMEGFHYFDINGLGVYIPKPAKPGERRGCVPLMRSIYRRELGRFTDNILTVQAFPRSPNNPMAFYKAARAEAMINAWQEETDFEDVYAEHASDLLYYGMGAMHRYVDQNRKQVFSEAWPAWDLFPIPWNVTRDEQLEGFMRVRMMPKDWIEENIGKQAASMSQSGIGIGPRVGGAMFGNRIGSSFADKYTAAGEVIWVWLLPTKTVPSGQHYICVGNEMFGYQATDPQGNPITGPLANYEFPVEFTRYTRQKENWYGFGLLQSLLGAQAEADANWTKTLRRARFANGMMFYDPDYLNADDIENADQDIMPVEMGTYGAEREYVKVVAPVPDSPEFGTATSYSLDLGRMAAGHESDILFGKAEGRVESGPLGRILNVNAQAPLAPTMRSVYNTLRRHYSPVLDLITQVWPDGKRVATIGRYNLPNEIQLSREGRPTSQDVILRPSPLVPAGKGEMYNLLVALRQMPSDEGKPEISSAEFRRGLASIGMSPPGLDIISKVEERVHQRVSELFNDGQTPGAWFRDPVDRKLMVLEDPKALAAALKEMILEPGFRASASPQVKLAFLQALEDLRRLYLGTGATDDRSDENLDLEAHDARKSEESLDAVEQSPDMSLMFKHENIPVGIGMGA